MSYCDIVVFFQKKTQFKRGRNSAGMTSKGIKREAACRLAFDFRSSQTSKRNNAKKADA